MIASAASITLRLLAAALLHELGHVASAKVAGVEVKRMGLSRKALFVRCASGTPSQNMWIALAGPAANFVVALLCWRIFPQFAGTNVLLGILSLLPFRSSDGWQAIRSARIALRRIAIATPTSLVP